MPGSRYKRIIRDGINLTTLIRWVKHSEGSFTLGRENMTAGGRTKWTLVIMRGFMVKASRGRRIVYDSKHTDLSVLVSRGADAIRQTAEWHKWDLADDGSKKSLADTAEVKDEEVTYDYDIWKHGGGEVKKTEGVTETAG